MHRHRAFHEGILKEAQAVIVAPHQALHDAGNPHRGDVQHDADRGDPQVGVDQFQ